jgi:hypothetical protein
MELALYDNGVLVRAIYAGRGDDLRWTFDEAGERLPFEETERYERRRVRDRLTLDMLARYLEAWAGIRVLDAGYYAPQNWGVLLQNPSFAILEATLDEAQLQR